MTVKKNLVLFLFLVLPAAGYSYTERNLLQNKAPLSRLREVLLLRQQWVPYPAYSDRQGWDLLTGAYKAQLIRQGEEHLQYQWKVVKATDYLEYERSGSRRIMEEPFGANVSALNHLVLAELAEGKGRFLDQIINGVWLSCEMATWALSAHLPKRSLPDPSVPVIDLTAGDLGSFLSWTYFLLGNELDKVNPVISKHLLRNLQERILDPFLKRNDFWWQALEYKPGMLINNWNPWCNFNVLSCFLLLENDPERLAEAVAKTMRSVDRFINYNHEDGACEEGPSYWGHAAGKLYDYLQLLSYATGGRVSIFDEPIIKNLGEYIAYSYIGNGWVVNFADASARGGGAAGVIYRYGKAVKSPEMEQFAAYLAARDETYGFVNGGRDIFRTFENLASLPGLKQISPALPVKAFKWYPQTEFCYMRQGDYFFAAKGGYNNESHNHNDVGSFILYYRNIPLFVDAGVGTYTRQTFSKERYTIWTMQSDYHNLPQINGTSQAYGPQYKARNTRFSETDRTFSLDIAGAYNEGNAARWQRTYTLDKKGKGLVITDDFALLKTVHPNIVHFMTWKKPALLRPGKIGFALDGLTLEITYDPGLFTPEIETVPQTDKRLSSVWGPELYRLRFKALKQVPNGTYRFTVTTGE